MLKNKLTIVVVAHNLVSLCYPFIESLLSALPLQCNFLVGDCDSTDGTHHVYAKLQRHLPLTITKLNWLASRPAGHAIGAATQTLIDRATTPYVLNLQACEVLCDDAIKSLQTCLDGKRSFRFRHFFGHFGFDGAIGGHAYGLAPRIYDHSTNISDTDGCWPYDWNSNDWPVAGTIHRYSYCFDNQVAAKSHNHFALYHGDTQTPTARLASINWCKQRHNFDGPHPSCVAHLIGKSNYDVDDSLRAAIAILTSN